MPSYRKPTRRNSLRKTWHDYTQPGDYFVTVCTVDHLHLLGEITENDMNLSDFGRVVRYNWQHIMEITPNFNSPEWVIMPNHLHAIVTITYPESLESPSVPNPDWKKRTNVSSNSLSAIMRTFKSVTTRRINKMQHSPGRDVWQQNYYDHIIEDRQTFFATRNYIRNNPANWPHDPEHENNLREWNT